MTKEIIGKMMKQHELQIKSIIENSLANPMIHFNESNTNVLVEDDAQTGHVYYSTNNEQSKVDIHCDQLGQLRSAINDNNAQCVSQLYANEQSELKYLLIKDELTKRQNILDEVLLINEALQLKIKDYELNNLQLPPVQMPTSVTHSAVQTDDSIGLIGQGLRRANSLNENRIQRQNFLKEEDFVDSLSVFSSFELSRLNDDDDSVNALKETINKLKFDERKRKKKLEKLILKNFTLKLEVCELKKEIKKYSHVWANDRYFNSLFLDASRITLSKGP